MGSKGMIHVRVFDAEGNVPLEFDDIEQVYFINEETHSDAERLAQRGSNQAVLFVNARLALAVELR
jgi:hypothetical protein